MPISEQPAQMVDRQGASESPQKELIMQSSFDSLSMAASHRERDLQNTAARVQLARAARSPRLDAAARRPSAMRAILAAVSLRLRIARPTAPASIAR